MRRSLIAVFLAISAQLAHADIFSSVGRGDLADVKQALSDGAKIDNKGPSNQTPLMKAVLEGKADIVEYLLKAGASVKLTDGATPAEGYTPIHGAAFNGHAKIAKMLIEHGMAPCERHEDGFSPMHRACWGDKAGHAATVAVFLKAGCDPYQMSKDGNYPLAMAVEAKNKGTESLLRKALKKKDGGKKFDSKEEKRQMDAGVRAKAEQEAQQQMAQMMQRPDFQNLINQMMGKFGDNPTGAADMERQLKERAAQAAQAGTNMKDPDALMNIMKGMLNGDKKEL